MKNNDVVGEIFKGAEMGKLKEQQKEGSAVCCNLKYTMLDITVEPSCWRRRSLIFDGQLVDGVGAR